MTPRERALAVYRFQETDVPCFDLMEGTVWPELAEDFINKYGMSDLEQIQTALGCDFRWTIFRTRFNPDGKRRIIPERLRMQTMWEREY